MLALLARGDAYKLIAHKLALSIETVRMNVKGIYRKLHVHSRGEAVAKLMAGHDSRRLVVLIPVPIPVFVGIGDNVRPC